MKTLLLLCLLTFIPLAWGNAASPSDDKRCEDLVPSIQSVRFTQRLGQPLGPNQRILLDTWESLCPATPAWHRSGVSPTDGTPYVKHAPGPSPRIRTECRTYAMSGTHCMTWTE